MDILIIAPEYPPRIIGGGGRVFQNLSHELNNRDHNIKVLAGSFSNRKLIGQVEFFCDNGVEVFFIPLIPYPEPKGIDIATYTLPTLSGVLFVIKELLRSKNKIIHLHGLCHPIVDIAALTCMIMHKKYVFTCHGIPKSLETAGFPLKALFKIYLSTIERVVIGKARVATVISRGLMKECCEKTLVNKNMSIVNNGLNQTLVRSNPKSIEIIEEKYSLKNDSVIFAIGRLNPTKGFQYLILAMKEIVVKLPTAVAIIAGKGAYKRDLQTLIDQNKLSDKVKLIGWISEEEKAAFFERSDIVVFPSLQEPFGLVILEAFSKQKPVVAFRTDSAVDIISHKSDGLLVPIGAKDKLAEGILEILEDKTLRQKMVEKTRAKVAMFDWKYIVEKYLGIYRKAQQEENLERSSTQRHLS